MSGKATFFWLLVALTIAWLSMRSSAPPSTTEAKKIYDQVPKPTVIPKELLDWQIATGKSPVDDKPVVHIWVSAKDVIYDRRERARLPELRIQCSENKTSALIYFAGVFVADSGGYGDVTVRLDSAPARKVSMTESTDNTALGLWGGGTAIPFIKSMVGRSNMFVRATPFKERAVDMEFPITPKFAELLPEVRKACNW